MPLELFEYPKALFKLESDIAELKLVISNLEIEQRQLVAKITAPLKGVRFKSEQMRVDEMNSLLYTDSGYVRLEGTLAEKRNALDIRKAEQAEKRREFRLLESERAISGLSRWPHEEE